MNVDSTPTLTAAYVTASGHQLVRNLVTVPAGINALDVVNSIVTHFGTWVRFTSPQLDPGLRWPATPQGLASAWNAWVSTRNGHYRFTPARCAHCRGRGFTTRNIARNIARTGTPHVCAECRGTRRGRPVTIALRPHS